MANKFWKTLRLFIIPFLLIFGSSSQAEEKANRKMVPCHEHGSPCHVDSRLEMAGIENPEEVRLFLKKLKKSIQDNDRKTFVSLIKYPFSQYENGIREKLYLNEQDVLENFDALITPRVKSAILNAQYETLFVNSGGVMIGDGEVWFDGWGTEIIKGSKIKIKSINN